ncbi:ku70-like protein [Dichomitus squalens LYAD-421 SS1]|uniref:ATP-dependent DNA helicase II subunit 1 n=1 Tax=Dichomitus squalens (strain LYAD-421) TaxID=732165 RepID=R7SVZ7_DICSQ|nr:ku70-like protein [Dichomitus squalens LYAD-421 SS1]EJF59137.1 ku70-like protein [Dichomitus squalens LYAD-421 SS1]
MAPYDDWNKIEDEDDEELQDYSFYDGKRDVILFCIDCSPSMLELREDPRYEDVQTCNLMIALEAAMQIQKRKVLVGPSDSVGIMLFNTTKRNESGTVGADIKKGTFVYQPLATIDVPKVAQLLQLLDEARENPGVLREEFPPMKDKRIPVGDVFTSCNWVMRDGAPKTATKRVFFITDEDNPHPGAAISRLMTSARTTLIDLVQAGVTVEPFFISADEKPFDPSRFYSSVLLPTNITDSDDIGDNDGSSILPESISIGRIDELLAQMRFHEVPKRAAFSVPFQLAPDFVIGVKGYGLITEQKKGAYRYFAETDAGVEVVESRTSYVDEEQEEEVDKGQILYGMDLGAPSAEAGDEEGDAKGVDAGTRSVAFGYRVFYTAEEVRAFRTLGLEPGIKLLGFKGRKELAFEDNIKHSFFIYPDEMTFSGSKRTFTALLRTMISKKKIAIVLALTRRNSSPIFCAMLPQEEKVDESGWREPPGFHLIPLPFADDIRAAPVERAFRASDELKEAARKWIDKLNVKNGSYPPDSYPNPALAYHNAQLEAQAFREDFDAEAFEDLTEPKYDMIHKRAGQLIKAWKEELREDESANIVSAPLAGSKRKADVSVDEAEVRSKYEAGALAKLRVDQLKEFLKSKGEAVSGKKADLIDRVCEWLDSHG